MVAVEGGCGEGSLKFGIAIEGSKLMGIINKRQGNLDPRFAACTAGRWNLPRWGHCRGCRCGQRSKAQLRAWPLEAWDGDRSWRPKHSDSVQVRDSLTSARSRKRSSPRTEPEIPSLGSGHGSQLWKWFLSGLSRNRRRGTEDRSNNFRGILLRRRDMALTGRPVEAKFILGRQGSNAEQVF